MRKDERDIDNEQSDTHDNNTFSDTILLFPLSSSGAIHGKVPRTPPDTRV